MELQFGLETFGDNTVDLDGQPVHSAQVLRNVVAEGVLADELGIDAFGVGEHHRDDYAISAPETVLAGLATVTKNIKLGTAVTVLSSDDPIRVYQRFATVDALSNGRAELIVGRGSFTESFPLFGFNLADYEVLFEEKLDLLSKLLKEDPVTWTGQHRTPLNEQHVYPKTENGMTAWIGVGGSPESVVRAAKYQFPMMLAIIGGDPARFAPYANLYRRALDQLGHEPLPIGVHSPGYIGQTDEEALTEFWPHYRVMRDRIGRERGWPPAGEEEYRHEAQYGSLYVGSAETVARRIASTVQAIGAQRFDLKYSAGTLPHELAMASIRRYGEDVVPLVRESLSAAAAAPAPALA